MDNKKITCIEGLRTIGWMGVFLCHFKGAMFPGVHWWTDATPLRFIYSGNAYVRLLFVISGFVIAYKYFTKEKYENALGDIVKRYFRFMPPILVAELMVYFLMNVGALRNVDAATLTGSYDFLAIFNQFEPSLFRCLGEALFATYFTGASGYIGPLWTMVYEYLGSILIIAAMSLMKKKVWRWVFYIVFLGAFSGYYNYFVLGMLICDLFVNSDIADILRCHKLIHLALTGGGYVALSMINLSDVDKYSRIVFGLGIALFLLGILSSHFMEKLLGNSIMIKGGEIAYCAYIIHWPVIETFSCGLLLLLYGVSGISYSFLVWMIFFATLFIVVIAAVLLNRLVEPVGVFLAREVSAVIDGKDYNIV
ncbi:MAG: acyltransferase [Ruminococcus flavefaciens]|nr:acyltransferase [Ruminococcus flavefaciens]